MNIVIIGYRGTGKTSVGKMLAQRLGMRFVDGDVCLEQKVGRTINDMVAREGWPFFRAKEKEVIREISGYDGCVIATGGGAVMDADNVSALERNGRFILLTADIPTTVSRIQADSVSAQQRPDLLGGGIVEETKKILAQRMPIYRKVADHVIDTTSLSVEQVVESILGFLKS
jgi:shikimate kinase